MSGLYLISTGIWDEKDISLRGLEVARRCDILFAEFYTTRIGTTKERLEKLIGKKIKVLSRSDLEEGCDQILEKAKEKEVGILVGGDCLVSTTHSSVLLEAKKRGIPTKVIHSSSIISAVAETGLHLQKFGQFITVPFPEKISFCFCTPKGQER